MRTRGRITGGDARTRGLIVTVLIATMAIVLAVDMLFGGMISAALERDAKADARRWADALAAEATMLDGVDPADGPDPAGAVAAAASRALHLDIRFFDAAGRPVPAPGATPPAILPPVESHARRAVETGLRSVALTGPEQGQGGGLRHAVAYMPRRDASGAVVGAVAVSVDQPGQRAAITRTVRLIGLGLPILCALLFLLPALAVLLSAERARARKVAAGRLARIDPLTGTLNRASLQEALARALGAAGVTGDLVGILAIDVDRLKAINDEHGAAAGDRRLREVADILRGSLRPGDALGRMAGDRFVAVLPAIEARRLAAIAGDALSAARRPAGARDRAEPGSLSIGSHLAHPAEEAVRSLRAADLALRQAKMQGRNRVVSYSPSFDEEDRRQRLVACALRNAWSSGRMELHFQPLVAARDGRVLGHEALLRLNAPDGSPISPAEFIPVAERTGLIHDLGIETLERALRTAAGWPADRFVSVNLSPEQFRRPDLADRIAAVLDATGFPPGRLELEVTESVLIGEQERVAEQLIRLKALGLALALDDFGTGYSSLGHLFRFSFDKLKIDRVFLEGYSFDSPKHREIIEIIVLLGHKLGMKVVAEGVETEAQRAMLARLDCDQLQGFLFGRPVPAEEVAGAERRNPSAA
ncbi:putative bifunctional diguanylate cyclase/phosphodiesterase [Jannaschia formosa]|uniref:putative bifunctional diguanylate cyclase/phosphodiesterase n=1 Tax=Jannaschia formosa TaxID=2259592 RepID=UPI00143035B6|nr:bifunctional diguanylate cyclase/phosphodiesterase [Jannaschia formosa]